MTSLDKEVKVDLFRNRQWRVTSDGLSTTAQLSVQVHLNAESLLEVRECRDGKRYYKWPLQFAEKSWADIDAFIDAFRKALELLNLEFERKRLDASCDAARLVHEQDFPYLYDAGEMQRRMLSELRDERLGLDWHKQNS